MQIHTQCRYGKDWSKSAETLQNTRYTIVWVKDSSTVPEDYKDLLRSEYNIYGLYTLNSALILSDQHLLCGADKRLHRHLGNAFLAKYYNVYVVDINIATRYNAWLSQDWSSHTSALLASVRDRRTYINSTVYVQVVCLYRNHVY